MPRTMIVSIALILVLVCLASAGPNSDFKAAIHVVPQGDRDCSSGLPVVCYCGNINTTYPDTGYVDIFPVFYGLTEFKGIEYGITWPGGWSAEAWENCADLMVGDLSDPSQGISQVWTTCRTSPCIVPAWIRLHAPSSGLIQMATHPISGLIQVVDCNDFTPSYDQPVGVYDAGVGGVPGDDPCPGSPPYVRTFTEYFTTFDYCDTSATTALWDTSGTGEIRLYRFQASVAGAADTPGEAYATAVAGNYAYVADGSGDLQVFDVTEPASPESVASLPLSGSAYDIEVAGNYAFLACDTDGGLQMVNISDPEHPTAPGFYNTPGVAAGVAVSGNYVYVADYTGGFQVVDITDPESPSYEGSCSTLGNPAGVAVSGDYAYLATVSGGLEVIDITDPAQPAPVDTFTTADAYDVAVSGNYAYLAAHSGGLVVVDITDPTSVGPSYSLTTPDDAYSVAVTGDWAYVAVWGSGLLVVDITDPESPTPVDTLDTYLARGVTVVGDYAYVADYSEGLKVIDVAELVFPPRQIALCPDMGDAKSVCIEGDYAYVTDGDLGLAVVDVSDPRNPIFRTSCSTPGSAWDVAVAGDVAYVADYKPDLLIVDISDPLNPTWEGGYDWPGGYAGEHPYGYASDIAVSGDYAYLADGQTGLRVFDISGGNSTKPLLVKTIGSGGYNHEFLAIEIAGSYAYIADGMEGLKVADLSTPSSPAFKGTYNTPGYVYGLAVDGTEVYVADGENGLLAIDVADPDAPALAGSYDTPGTAYHVAVQKPYAYVADGRYGLQVIDVTKRETILSGEMASTWDIRNVDVSGNYAYLACGDSGLATANVSNPQNPYTTAKHRYGGQADVRDVVEIGGNAFVADSLYGLQIMDVNRSDRILFKGRCSAFGAVGIAVLDSFACMAVGSSGLQIIDVDDPTSPDSVAIVNTPGHAWSVCMDTSYAYVADGGSGLQVIDISDPRAPVLTGSYDTPGTTLGLDVSDTLICLADSDSLVLLSVETPSAPYYLASYPTPGIARDVTIVRNFAMIADDSTGFMAIDVSDPSNPFLVTEFDTEGHAYGVDERDMYAFIADYEGGLKAVHFTFVLADSIRWNPHWHEASQANARHVSLADSRFAFLVDFSIWGGDWGIVSVDISDPTDLDALRSPVVYHLPGEARHSVVRDSLVYVSDGTAGFHIMRFDASGVLTLDGTCGTPGLAKALALKDSLAYIADDVTGIWVADISDSTRPALVGALGSYGASLSVVTAGNTAYVTGTGRPRHDCGGGQYTGLKAVDISNPHRPEIQSTSIGCSTTAARPGRAAVSGDYAVMADQSAVTGSFYVVDTSNPDSLYVLGTDGRPSQGMNAVADGDIAVVADAFYGVLIYDISDPPHPEKIVELGSAKWGDCRHCACGDWYTIDAPLNVAVVGDYIFVADDVYGLWVVDLSVMDPPDSVCPFGWPTPVTGLWDMDVAGDHLFAAQNGGGLQVFSVFSREFKHELNTIQSLPVAATTEDIARVQLDASPAYVDSLRWEVSADGGVNWKAIVSGSAGTAIDSVGQELLWRSLHYPVYDRVNPSCENLSLEWWFACAVIDSVKDVQDDQGGYVRVYFSRSGYDFEDDSSPIQTYTIWRRTEDMLLARNVLAEGTVYLLGSASPLLKASESVPELKGDLSLMTYDGRLFLLSSSDSFAWESVGSVGAIQENFYEVSVPTYRDSVNACYIVSAHREDPSEWYLSPVSGGYSVDNVGMMALESLRLVDESTIAWKASLEEDLDHYRVYSQADSLISSKTASLVAQTTDTTYVLPDSTVDHYVFVTACDHAGHESGPSNAVLNSPQAIRPKVYALAQNAPNPFSPSTTIKFALPEAAEVRLTVYDVTGRLVATVARGTYEPGRWKAEWDGRDAHGGSAGPGVYFYKLEANHYRETRKMILVR